MNLETYSWGAVSADGLEYEFISRGPRGDIRKVIQFVETGHPLVYNLAFGDSQNDGGIDDQVRNDNGDRNMILATVASAVRMFCDRYEDVYVFFTGSTPGRTRLYRMALTIHFDELSVKLEIYGLCTRRLTMVKFERGVAYLGFFVKRKSIKLDV